MQSVAYLNKWNIGMLLGSKNFFASLTFLFFHHETGLIRTSFNKIACKVWLPTHKSYSRRFSSETQDPKKLKEFVKHGLSNDTSRECSSMKSQQPDRSMFLVGTKEDQERAADSLNGLQIVHEGEIYTIQLADDIHPVQIDNIEQQEDGSVKAYLVGVDKTVTFKSGQLEQLGISLSTSDQTLTTPQGASNKMRKTRQCCGTDEQGNRCTNHTLSEYRIRKDDSDPAWIPLCDNHQFQILHPGFSPAVK